MKLWTKEITRVYVDKGGEEGRKTWKWYWWVFFNSFVIFWEGGDTFLKEVVEVVVSLVFEVDFVEVVLLVREEVFLNNEWEIFVAKEKWKK